MRRTARLLTATTLLAAYATGAGAQPAPADTGQAIHLLRRATFGVRPADLADVLRIGTDAWLEAQLHPARIADDALDRRLAPLARLERPAAELYALFPPPDALARELAERHGIDPARLREADGRSALPPAARREFRERRPRRLIEELVTAKLIRSVHAERQLAEVMTDFWFNHFNVHAGKQLTRYLVAAYEREAIRPHVFGRFEDMLLATARHPAMLFYLDNWTSVAPDSMRPRRAGAQSAGRIRNRGINENYARELLELHTLGVDGGYGEDDVVAVARALTGWTFVPFRAARASAAGGRGPLAGRAPGTFLFNAPAHDRGAKTILGQTFPAGGGLGEGTEVIRLLARHPQTARFLSAKLIERFVSDVPDPAFVAELEAVWMRSGGDLREVTRALFASPRFRAAAVRGTKIKTPFELVVSALRAAGAEAGPSRPLMETLRALGQLPYDASAPTGYPAASHDWVNSGAMLARMNFGLDLAAGRIDGVRPGIPVGDDPVVLVHRVLPGIDATTLAGVIREDAALNAYAPGGAGTRALGLALGSPEFQQR